jgi:hypothetical protein
MWSEYKLYIIAAFLVVWSVGIWHVSGQVKENAFNEERLKNAQAIIKVQEANATLAQRVSKELQEGLQQFADQSKKDKKALTDEIKSNRVYSDCKLTDSVRDQYKRKLEAQR